MGFKPNIECNTNIDLNIESRGGEKLFFLLLKLFANVTTRNVAKVKRVSGTRKFHYFIQKY